MAESFSPDAASARHDRRVAGAVVALIAVTVLLGALAPAPSSRAVFASPGDDPSCVEWSDGCTVCQRSEDGAACSLPGIACVRGEAQCVRRVGG